MEKKMKKIILILLMLTALCLFGCGSDEAGGETDVTTEAFDEIEMLTLIEKGKSDYAIIHASGDVDSDAAYRLSTLIKRACGVSISPKKDNALFKIIRFTLIYYIHLNLQLHTTH